MVLIVWCYSLTFSIVPALNIGFSKYVPEGYLTSCSFDYLDKTIKARIFMFVFFIFAWLIPFTIITYCYVYILKAVISSRHIRSSMDKHKTDIKLSIVVIGVIILWFVHHTMVYTKLYKLTKLSPSIGSLLGHPTLSSLYWGYPAMKTKFLHLVQ